MQTETAPPPAAPPPITSDAALVSVTGPLTVATAESWRERLQSHCASSNPVGVDLGGVTQWDTLGVQLLCALARSAETRGQSVGFVGCPPDLGTFVRRLGLDNSTFSPLAHLSS